MAALCPPCTFEDHWRCKRVVPVSTVLPEAQRYGHLDFECECWCRQHPAMQEVGDPVELPPLVEGVTHEWGEITAHEVIGAWDAEGMTHEVTWGETALVSTAGFVAILALAAGVGWTAAWLAMRGGNLRLFVAAVIAGSVGRALWGWWRS